MHAAPVDALCELAPALLGDGYSATALALLQEGIARAPDALALRYWHGNALRMHGLHDRAESVLRDVLAQQPEHRDAAWSLAYMLREQGRFEAVGDVVVELARRHERERELILSALQFLVECGAHARARAIAVGAIQSWPQDARVNVVGGEILLALGEFDTARACLVHALELDPQQSTAWLRLAQCQRYTAQDRADLARFRAAATNSALSRDARTCAGFALGKALDDIGSYAEAAAALRDANAAAAADAPWDAQRWQALVATQLATVAAPPATAFDPGFTPVFIVGLPRSGTTLVATHLGQYADVHDRGELNWISAMYEHLLTHG